MPGSAALLRDAPPPQGAGASRLDAHHLEALLLNLDATPHVHTRAQLFGWTQGLLQNLIHHRALICALRRNAAATFAIDCFSTLVAESGAHGDLLVRDTAPVAVLAEAWRQHRFQPVLCRSGDFSALAGGAFAQELRRADASELLVHGSHDADGEVAGLCVFAGQPGAYGPRELYLLQLIGPALHTAWVRTQTRAATDEVRTAATPGGVLTERERGILHWVYLGKSNGEIGAILNISALTVKNHVQKILRKLNVVNRAQAVGRALDARIIRP